MASASTHTSGPRLSVLVAPPKQCEAHEALHLQPSPGVNRFAVAAANAGLSLAEAAQMTVERALALGDGARFCGDAEVARRKLCRAAADARPNRELGAAEAERVRRLMVARPVEAEEVGVRLIVPLPSRLLSRLGTLGPSCLRADALREAIKWEVAGCLQGRTLGEWALWTLAERP